jgi:group I intron endonuclease
MENTINNYIIYKAENTFTGESYIGATTKSIEERKADHLRKSNNGLGSYFQEAIGTYGSDAFNWEQIDTASNINELAEKEAEYILKFNSFKAGYNQNKGAGGFKKIVYQYSIETGEFLNSYDDLTCAGNAVNATKKSVGNVCLHIDKTCKGYYWSYSSTDESYSNPDLRKKEVMQYSLEGNLLTQYISVAEASKISGLSKTCISRCCRGERENSGGFIWKYC